MRVPHGTRASRTPYPGAQPSRCSSNRLRDARRHNRRPPTDWRNRDTLLRAPTTSRCTSAAPSADAAAVHRRANGPTSSRSPRARIDADGGERGLNERSARTRARRRARSKPGSSTGLGSPGATSSSASSRPRAIRCSVAEAVVCTVASARMTSHPWQIDGPLTLAELIGSPLERAIQTLVQDGATTVRTWRAQP